MDDKTIKLANKIGASLSTEELDHVIPALTMVLSHAVSMTDIPTESIMDFIQNAILLTRDEDGANQVRH
jgi:hypothetical protein